jgi:hypothetical protein
MPGSSEGQESRQMSRKTGLSKMQRQWKAVRIRAKYGPSCKPAKVVVRSLETGDVEAMVDQSYFNTTKARPR